MINDMKCGCGKPVRYMMGDSFENGACNKYKRCRTYEELEQHLEAANHALRDFTSLNVSIASYSLACEFSEKHKGALGAAGCFNRKG